MYSIKTIVSSCTMYAGVCDACHSHEMCDYYYGFADSVPSKSVFLSEEEHLALQSTTYVVEETAICYPQYMAGWRLKRLYSVLRELPEEVAKNRAELYLDFATKRYNLEKDERIKSLIEFYENFLKGGEF